MRKVYVAFPRVKIYGVADADIPSFSIVVDESAIANALLAEIAERLGGVSGEWRGFAEWLVGEISSDGVDVTYPESAAIDRLGAVDVTEEMLERCIRDGITLE